MLLAIDCILEDFPNSDSQATNYMDAGLSNNRAISITFDVN